VDPLTGENARSDSDSDGVCISIFSWLSFGGVFEFIIIDLYCASEQTAAGQTVDVLSFFVGIMIDVRLLY